MITKINTVTLYVGDQQKARDFYVEHLGLRVRRDEDMGPMGRWLEVAPEGAESGFMLASAAGFGKQDQIGASADIVLHTDDVPATMTCTPSGGGPFTEHPNPAWLGTVGDGSQINRVNASGTNISRWLSFRSRT